MKTTLLFATAFAALSATTSAYAVTVAPTGDATALANATLAASSGISIVAGSAALIGEKDQQGIYSGFNLDSDTAPTLVLKDGIVLTSGSANFSTTENQFAEATVDSGTGAFQPLVDLALAGGLNTTQFNSNVLSFKFTLDDPTKNAVKAQFLFGTDEFPTQNVTDIMGIFVNGVNYAFFSNGDLVSNQSGDPNNFFNSNPVGSDATTSYGIEWNGLTDVFNVTLLALGGGQENLIEIAIADTFDTRFDSAVFFGNLTAIKTGGGGGIDPVPLPASVWLMLAGIGAIGAMKRRKKAA